MNLYKDNKKFTKDEALMELLKDKGFTTEPPKPKNKYNPNGSLRVMPKYAEKYYYIDSHGDVASWICSVDNSYRLYTQNMFDTEEAAMKALTMQLVAQPLIAKVWEMDLEVEGKTTCYFGYCLIGRRFDFIFSNGTWLRQEMSMSEKAARHLLSGHYTDKQRAAFLNDVKLWESFGGKIGDEKE